jgi:uncharacterized protein YjbI with pentapeptide repeats
MFGQSRASCPVEPESRAWLDQRLEWLVKQFGLARLRSAQVVLPTPEFFPDAYSSSEADVRVMLNRVCVYMDLDPGTVDLHFYQDRNPLHEGEFRRGTAGLYEAVGGKHRVWIEASKVHDPLALVATLAHELGHVHLLGHGRISPEAEDHELLTDLLTVFLGLGVITANAVIRESYWNAGHVGGWSISRQGYLTMPMYGYALAWFTRARDEDKPSWVKHLRADVRSAFKQSCRFLDDPESGGAAGILSAATETSPAENGAPPLTPDSEEPLGNGGQEYSDAEDEVKAMSAARLLESYRKEERNFANVNLRGVRLRKADLRGANFSGAYLREADLAQAVLAHADLSEAVLEQAELAGAVLEEANLNRAELTGANLTKANLRGADLRGADFRGACLREAVLVNTVRDRATDLSGADLTGVICDADLSKEDLRGVTSIQAVAEPVDRARRIIMIPIVWAFVAFMGAAVGCVVAHVLGRMTGKRDLEGPGAIAGAAVFGLFAVWKYMRARK